METQYLVRQPAKLESLAVVKLADWIVLQAKKLMAPELHANRLMQVIRLFSRARKSSQDEDSLPQQIENIRNVLEINVPNGVHDKLAIETIRVLLELAEKTKLSLRSKYMDSRERNVILRITETLFTKNLTSLRVNYANMGLLRESLFFKTYMLTGLTRLELCLMHGYLDTVDEANIIQMLKALNSLKFLTLKAICTDNILKCVQENCKLIEELNLIYSRCIYDKSMDILAQLSNLRSVNLSGTAVTEIGIKHLLLSCTNVEEVVDFYSNTIAQALEHIATFEGSAGIQFKLKSYSNHKKTTQEQFKLVVEMCPQIQNIYLSKNCTFQGNLLVFNNLQDLQELKLDNFDFYADHVKELLEARGFKITSLHLKRVNQVDLDAIMLIGQMCPNLQSLIIEGCNLTYDR